MTVNILLIARRREDQQRYLELMRALDADIRAVEAFKNLDRTVTERRYHGLMVDLPTHFNAVREDRTFVHNIMTKFPFLLVSLAKERDRVNAMYVGQTHRASLEEFIEKQCRAFSPRRFRYQVRKDIHFNLRLTVEGSDGRDADRRTNTVNVSVGGCFVYSARPPEVGAQVRLVFEEFDDPTPVRAEVRHAVPWGTPMRMPGMGVEFVTIAPAQVDQIRRDGYL